MSRWIAMALGLGLVLSCGGRGAMRPEQALERYLGLVAARKNAEAYQMMSAAYRERCDLLCFSRTLERDPASAGRLLGQVRTGSWQTELLAEVTLSDTERLRLVRRSPAPAGVRGDGFWLSGDPLDFYPQGTPQQALSSFLRAVEDRRYAVLLRFVPQKLRQQVTVERLRERWEGEQQAALKEQILTVRKHLQEPLLVEGDAARLPVGERKEVRLVLEDGNWRVLQLQ